jgi:hypothetical protein
MNRTAKFAAMLLVLVMAGAPVMACMIPAGGLSAEEDACCREMGPQCGSDQMPSSHSCCKTVASSAQLSLIRTPFDLQHLYLVIYLPEQTVSARTISGRVFAAFATYDHSPPEASVPSPDILRI